MDWQPKSIWYGFKILDNRLSQNVIDIRRSDEVYQANHEKLECGIASKKKHFSLGENLDKYIQEWWAITISICKSDDATQSYP